MDLLRKTVVLLCLVGLALAACASGPRLRRVTIVHTNDLHGHIERAAAVAAVAKQARDENPATLFLDAGDCISGTPVSTLFKGRPIFEIMSLMDYDAVVVGNHEFDHGWQLIAEYQELAEFPLLCANAKDPEGRPFGDAPYRVFDVGGVRIGVIGLTTDDVPSLTTKSASAGCRFESPIDAAKRLVPEVRAKSDVVVLLTHLGVEGDAALAGAVPDVDLIVGGHTHTELKEALTVGDTRIVQAMCYGRRVGVIELLWDTEDKRIASFKNRLVEIDADKMPNVPRVKEAVDSWEKRVDSLVSEVIGKTEKRLNKKRLRTAIERIYKELLGTDFGFQNMGGIRGVVEAGDIRVRDVWTVLPFDNTLIRLSLKGSELPTYNRNKLGRAFDPDRVYVLATNSYVGDQQKKYFDTADAPIEDTGLLMRDEVVKWVREHGGFVPRKDAKSPEERGLEPGEPR